MRLSLLGSVAAAMGLASGAVLTAGSSTTTALSASTVHPTTTSLSDPYPTGSDYLSKQCQILGTRVAGLWCAGFWEAEQALVEMGPYYVCHDDLCGMYGKNAWHDFVIGADTHGMEYYPNSTAVQPGINNTEADLFTTYLQGAIGSSNGSQFVNFNSILCLTIAYDVLPAMNMNDSMVRDSFCSVAKINNPPPDVSSLDQAVLQTIRKHKSLAFAWQFVIAHQAAETVMSRFPGFDCGNITSPNDPPSDLDNCPRTEESLQMQGLNVADFKSLYCLNQTVTVDVARTNIMQHLTDLFIAESIAAIKPVYKEYTMSYMCAHADAEGMCAVGLDGHRVVREWCQAGAPTWASSDFPTATSSASARVLTSVPQASLI